MQNIISEEMQMKKNTENFFLTIFLILQVMLFGAMIVFAVTLTNKASDNSREMLNQHALKVAEENMRERVDNVISLIEQERLNALEGVNSLGSTIYYNLSHQDENKLEEFLASWVPKIEQMQHGELIQLILHNKQTNRYMFYYHDEVNEVPVDIYSYKVMEYVNNAPYCKKVEYLYRTLYIISTQESIDKKAQEHIYRTVYATRYGQDGYVWTNEILNYDGGDDYAICRIHPNRKTAEGQYLSTNIQDAEGNYPYLKELEEIKEKGEIFHTFYSNEEEDNVIREKASYAKIYEPFNWIIATATPLDDVMIYSNALNEENQKSLSGMLHYAIIILIIIFLGDILLILYNNKKMKEKLHLEEQNASNEEKLKQADYEAMTGVLRRGVGEHKIKDYLQNSSNKDGILLIVDLDDLKKINDVLGHRAGDEAIIGIADVLKSSFRQTDIILRYGGDEFVVFVPEEGNNLDAVSKRMDMLVKKISLVTIGENKEQTIHGSIGCATTMPGDTFESLFSRADKALYCVKRKGKNGFACYSKEMENIC